MSIFKALTTLSTTPIRYVEELWDVNAAVNLLIAEYPTWQEAVNSKEFKDVAED